MLQSRQTKIEGLTPFRCIGSEAWKKRRRNAADGMDGIICAVVEKLGESVDEEAACNQVDASTCAVFREHGHVVRYN